MPARRIIVAGGAGFLGTYLCDVLLARGDLVTCVDDFSTGRASNIAHLLSRPGFRLVEQNICDPINATADEIYNLASPASPAQYQRAPVKTARTSALGTMNLLELATRCGAKFLQASTSEVYGDPQVHPQPETYWGHVNPTGIRACYDEGKRFAEALCYDYHRQYGTRIRIARIFNTYGPGMQAGDGRVIPNFITQALRGAPLTIYGEGRQTRSFCYRDDLVAGLIELMDAPEGAVTPFNLGNPEEIPIRSLAATILALMGSQSELRFLPLPQDDPRKRCPDITRAQTELGWFPRTSLRAGLEATIADLAARTGPLAGSGRSARKD